MVPRLLVALLLMTAGCTAVDDGSRPAEPTETTAPVSTDQSPTTTETPPLSTTTPTTAGLSGPTDDNTVAYAELTPPEQRAFDHALDGEARFVDENALDSPYVGDEYVARRTGEPFRTHDYVRKNGTLYRLSYEEGEVALAGYGIHATAEEPPEDAVVVALENVSAEIRDEVRWSVENGSYSVPYGKWFSLPQAFDRFDYVRSGDETYRLTIQYGDLFGDRLHVEPVESTER